MGLNIANNCEYLKIADFKELIKIKLEIKITRSYVDINKQY